MDSTAMRNFPATGHQATGDADSTVVTVLEGEIVEVTER
jgi:hypothetical protein